jgi:hypothetical protein
MSAFRRAAALAVTLLAGTAISFAAPVTLDTTLTPVAGTGSTASGTFTGTFDPVTDQLIFTLSWTGLTTDLVNAHIHLASAPGGDGGVLVPFFADGGVETISPPPPALPLGTSGSLAETITLTDAATIANFASGLSGGLLYVNVHSVTFPAGEIRGDLPVSASAVPEPSTFLLIGAGLVAVSLLCRRRAN